ncbi:hypothetical protein RN001_007020 [Aquatica leii]|uniref:Serpin domain-containing protein n=1 Tax=Aquatica leii TaxID=1421715 RepID=A0AAN7PLP5_9COLE|nr:hypothetical protein RN001_007020 [Aquatica leii]
MKVKEETSGEDLAQELTLVMIKMLLIFTLIGICIAHPAPEINTTDGQESRKVLGSRVVTSVSVIMDGVNNTKTYFSDAVGKPVAKPATPTQLASPINLLNPDRYEFYTFDDSGDLVKRLMTLDEIQGIIASGDGEPSNYYSQSLNGNTPEERVDEVINNVQNVLKEEIQAHIPFVNKSEINGPDITSTWNLILPAIFGTNSNAVPDNVSNALIPETLSIDKEATPATTEKEPETTLSNFDNSKTDNSNENELMMTTQNNIPNDQKTDSTTTSTIFETNPTTSTSNKAQTTVQSTIQSEEQKHATFYMDKTSSTTEQKEETTEITYAYKASQPTVTKSTPSTIKTTFSQEEASTYVDKTSTPTTMQQPNTETSSDSTIQVMTTPKKVFAFTLTTTVPSTLKSTIETKLPSTTPKESASTLTKTQEIKDIFAYVDKTSTPSIMESSSLKFAMETKLPSTTLKESTATLTNTQGIKDFLAHVDRTSTPSITESSTLKLAMETRLPSTTLKESTATLTNTQEIKDFFALVDRTSTPSITESSTLKLTMETRLPSTTLKESTTTLTNTQGIKDFLAHVDRTSTPSITESSTLKLTTDTKLPTTTLKESTSSLAKTQETKDVFAYVDNTSTPSIIKSTLKSTIETVTSPSTTPASTEQKLSTKDFEIKVLTTEEIDSSSSDEEKTIFVPISTTPTADVVKTTHFIKNEFLTTTEEDALFTTTSKMQSATVSSENETVDDFPVDELLNLLSSMGNRDTTVSELKTTMEVTTPQQTNPEFVENTTITQRVEVTTEVDQTSTTKDSVKPTIFIADRVEVDTTTTVTSFDTTTDFKQLQTLEIDKNINAAVDNVIFQMINEDVSHTTIDNLPTTESDLSTTSSSLIDVSEKNRYEEIDLENTETSTSVAYEGKTIQPVFEKFTTESFSTSSNKVVTSTDPNNYVTNAAQNFTVPIKNLKTDSLDSNYKVNKLNESTPTTTENYTPTEKAVYHITEFSVHVDNTTDTPLQLNVTSKPTTQPFVSIETITAPSKVEQQPDVHVINHVSSTTEKHDTTWKLVSTVAPHRTTPFTDFDKFPNSAVDLVPKPIQGFGLEDSTSSLDADVLQFTELCNELAFSFWNSVTSGISFARSVVVSPFATTSVLAMVFLGARGATSGEMNDILKLDDMVTFNPHAVFKNVVESIEVSQKSGVATSVFVKELYSDKNKGKLLQFYKERAKQFYDGYVEEVGFKEINDVIRRRTNLLVRRQTWGKIPEYLKDNSLFVRPPLAAITANIFQTDCSDASTTGRDGELHFVVLPSIRQRKLVPIPAVVYRSGFLAGYEPGLDATAVAIGSKDHTISTIFVIPGQQGISAPGDGLVRLETRLIESAFKQNAWSRLLRSLIPRPGLEVQIPRFSHRSVINATAALQRMGLKDVFNAKTADLKGLNGIAHELYLSDIIQTNTFATCGEGRIDETHHSEVYPATTNRSFRRVRKIQNYHQSPANGDLSDEPRDYQRAFHDPLYDPTYLSLPLQFRPRQARLPDSPRLRFDRPFLYFVRHNPTGLILHMGRFNPRLLP